ncbi:BTB/POZ and MATH domain-containing protein 2-like [Panicum miliaceum]|uniref:BTB/POZ and MATH domain-containing protein 2-like n=1 Tax=Panicum miliaceum TaxID=4540 RepID=A0A3L6RLR8_PANMI|nr:BTB/POZ and MATH domain-containing protein 2-like [Panicum miliaceum]
MEPVTATRTFEVPGYVRSNDILYAEPVTRQSAVFIAGGYNWSILYYHYSAYAAKSVDLCLQLETRGVKVTASISFSLLDPTAAMPPWKLTKAMPVEFSSADSEDYTKITQWVPKSKLNAPPGTGYLTRGGLLFQCTITIFAKAPAAAEMPSSQPKVPASDLMDNLGKIYATKDGSDVTYSVEGELFRAHKIILAMRSPVFYAELYGGMMESKAQLIQVQDMRHGVFEALLRYMYTDSLPTTEDGPADDDDGDDANEMLCGLLMAADRYGVERLRLLCEHRLSKVLNAGNVADLLAFADDQHCSILKDACIEFMVDSEKMKKVVASEGYKQLRSKRPLILVEVLEKSSWVRTVLTSKFLSF